MRFEGKNQKPSHIIDMRTRPPFLHDFFGATKGSKDYEIVKWVNRRVGSENIDHFASCNDISAYIKEISNAQIDRGVIVARSTPTVRVKNEDIAQLVASSEGRLIGVGSLDPLWLTSKELGEQAEAVLKTLAGINIDSAFYATPLAPDDPIFYPIYEVSTALEKPVFLMSGPTTPDLRLNNPFHVDEIAKRFPRLKIVCCHGYYPSVDAMLAVAFRNENVFVSPDMYLFTPGGHRYVEAAAGFLADQLVFGTSYPFKPMDQAVAELLNFGIPADLLEKIAWKNAARLLNLQI